jgi:hypothetical protein
MDVLNYTNMTILTINTSTDTKHNLNFSSRSLSVGTVTNGRHHHYRPVSAGGIGLVNGLLCWLNERQAGVRSCRGLVFTQLRDKITDSPSLPSDG